jgi:hypothetical protein
MTPVRTTVMEALCTALKTITELKTVKRFEPVPTDLARVAAPVAYLFDTAPETFDKNNRVMRAEQEVNIAVFIELTAKDTSERYRPFNDLADMFEAHIHNAMQSQVLDPTGIIESIEDLSSEREIANDSWGVLTYTIKVTYRHKFGDGFTAGH